MGEIIGPRSIIVLDGEQHRRVRAMMLPAFHGDAVRKQVAEMVAITAEEVARWPVGEPFPLLPRMQAITLEVILRTVIGVRDEARLAALRTALPELLEIGSPLTLLPPAGAAQCRAVASPRAAQGPGARAAARRDHPVSPGPELDTHTDVLAMMLRSAEGATMTDDELVDQLVTLLLAGHETTAIALAWTFERLTRSPELLDRTTTAAADGDDAWLDAVRKESLWVRPMVYQVGRNLTEPVQLGGYTLPAGTMLAPYMPLVHRSARYHPDPEQFRPQRFLDQRVDTAVWFPFGGGVRRCLGATFAQVEMRTVLSEVLRRVELAPTTAPDEPVRVRHVTLAPRHGAVMRVRRQSTAAEPPTSPTAGSAAQRRPGA